MKAERQSDLVTLLYAVFTIIILHVGMVKGQSQYMLEIRINGYSNLNQLRPFCAGSTCFSNLPQCCDQPDPPQQSCVVGGRCDSTFLYCLRTIGTSRSSLGCSYSGSRTSGVNTDDANLDFSSDMVLGLPNPLVLEGLTTTWTGVQLYIGIFDRDSDSFQVIDSIIEDASVNLLPIGQPSGNVTLTGIFGFVTMEVNVTVLCVPGFTGARCEAIDDCIGQTCSGNRRCVDGINTFTCECIPGFTGSNCEINIDECLSNPCGENGNCTDGTNTFTCNCEAGFTGMRCEVDINDCLSNPCGPDGQCVDGVNSFTCNCTGGFTGSLCDINIDDCSPNPCGERGECEDLINGYNCSCDPGFMGDTCQINIDDCVGVNCSGNGDCVDGVNTYTCDCLPSHTGWLCDALVNSKPNPQVSNRTGPIVGGAVGAIVCLILLAIIILVAILLFKRHQAQDGKGNGCNGVLPGDNPVYDNGNVTITYQHHITNDAQRRSHRGRAESSPSRELQNPIYGGDDITENVYADPDTENEPRIVTVGTGSVTYHKFDNPIYADGGMSNGMESTYSMVTEYVSSSKRPAEQQMYQNINQRPLLEESEQLYDSVPH